MSNQQLWQWVHHLYGSELGLTASDDDYEAPESALESDTPACPESNVSLHTTCPEYNVSPLTSCPESNISAVTSCLAPT